MESLFGGIGGLWNLYLAVLEACGTFRRWGLVEGSCVTGFVILKEILGPGYFLFLFVSWMLCSEETLPLGCAPAVMYSADIGPEQQDQ